MPTNLDDLIALGYVHRYECGFTGVSSSSSVYVGFVTGPEDVVALSRSYGGSTAALTVELFAASFTGGDPVRSLNRRLSSQRAAPLASMKQDVTPGALGVVITAATIRAGSSGGNASLVITSDESKLILDKNTSYVIRMTNGGNTADIGAAFDLRVAVDGESLEKVKA